MARGSADNQANGTAGSATASELAKVQPSNAGT